MPRTTTIGKVLVNEALPESMRDPDRELDKKKVKELFRELAEKYPEKYVDTLQSLTDVSRLAATEYGGVASVRLSDFRLPPRIKAYRKELSQKIETISQDPKMTAPQKNDAIVKLMRKAIPTIQKNLEQEALEHGNMFALSIAKGFRGSPVQLTQMLFGNMLVADHRGRPVPIPVLHGYAEGITDAEYWADSYGSRRGFADVQFATAKTGFFGKQMAQMAQRLKITGKDCGARGGLLVNGDDPEIIGSVLNRDMGDLKQGTAITKQDLPLLAGKKPLVRSVATCQMPDGICQKCAGKRESGEYPTTGSYIGITSARIVAEPMVQGLGLSSKHVGGQVGVNDEDVAGFDEINQFLQVPENFRGGSVLAPKDGRVTLVVKAPQGGHYVKIDDVQVHIPVERQLSIKKGDMVEAGDMLSDGTPNPAEIAQYKGLGEGRLYFIDKFRDILKDNKVPAHRRNVETLARAFFDKVQITNPEGMGDWSPGEIISYGNLQAQYQPRKGSELRNVRRAVGQYLEEPLLHYTIGTRITPKVAKFLEQEKISQVRAHPDSPGFEPYIVRAMDAVSTDPDWKTRMGAFNLKKSFLDSATKGSSSDYQGTSPVPFLMNPVQ